MSAPIPAEILALLFPPPAEGEVEIPDVTMSGEDFAKIFQAGCAVPPDDSHRAALSATFEARLARTRAAVDAVNALPPSADSDILGRSKHEK